MATPTPTPTPQSPEMSMRLSMRAAVLCGLLALVVGLAIGLLLGFVLSTRTTPNPDHDSRIALLKRLTHDGWIEEPEITKRIIHLIDPKNIRDNLRYLSKDPHLAGSYRDEQLAFYIRDSWIRQGLDTSDLSIYDVLLSYSDHKKPNVVQLLDLQGKIRFNSSYSETVLRPQDDHRDFVHAYHAYSPSGTVEGDLVYINQGTEEDFAYLDKNNVTLKKKIVLMREGAEATGTKVRMAQDRGAIGVITYPDPVDVAMEGTDEEDVYPYTQWLPGTGIVRSSAGISVGDPLTPGYPSITGAFRMRLKKTSLPLIPSQPIGYDDAEILLKFLAGPEVPDFWVGDLNLTYRMGPGFSRPYHKVRLQVNNRYRVVPSFNVIGTIRGSVEPDRYIILGNHRDAWGFGAIDPASGTATLMEVTRVFGIMLKEGWRPRRTLVFCSWGAEEFGLIGSTEWVEHKFPKLLNGAVAYINSDICVMGTQFHTMFSPILKDAVYEVTKMVPDPENIHSSIYEAWKSTSLGSEPDIDRLGPYSDFASFIFYAGIPVMDFNWQSENYSAGAYPTYHTGYETLYLLEKMIDPEFKRHQSCGRVSALMLRYMADSAVIPFSVRHFALNLRMEVNALKEEIEDILIRRGVPIVALIEAVSNFSVVAEEWQENVDRLDRRNPLAVRIINDQLIALEKTFVLLPKDSTDWFSRHRLLLAIVSVWNILGTVDYTSDDITKDEKQWEEIQRHLSDLLIVIHQASDILKGSNKF